MEESVKDVRRAFDSWRKQNLSKRRIYPESLRQRALALPRDERDDGELCKALGLSCAEILRNWRRQANSAEAKMLAPGAPTEPPTQFVEVATMTEVARAAGKTGEARCLELVLQSGDGRSLRVRGELDAAMLVGLAQVAVGTGGAHP